MTDGEVTLSEWWKSSCGGFIARNSEATTVFQVYNLDRFRSSSTSQRT